MLARELVHCRDDTGDEILTIFIPSIVKGLLERCARDERSHADELQAVRSECARDVASAESRATEDLHDCERECDELESRLAKANARADVYREIVERNLLK